MTVKRNGAEVGTTGTAVTDANKATTTADGDAFNTISITGSPTFEVSTAQAYYGTRSYHISGGSGTVATPRWTGLASTVVSGYVVFRLATLASSAITHIQCLHSSGSPGYASIAQNSSNQLQVKNAAGTPLSTLSGYTLLTNTWYRLEFRFNSGTTTGNGTIQCWLYAAAATDREGAGTPLASYSATNVDAGAGATFGQIKLMGKIESASTIDGYYDGYAVSNDATMPSLPGSNSAPVANAGADMNATAGTAGVHLSGTATDDTAVTTLAWTRVSGPDSPTVSTSTSGLGTATASATADVDVIAGTYVFRLTAGDGSLTHTDDVTVYVAPAANSYVGVDAVTLGAGTTFGSPASNLLAVTDASNSTGIQTADNPSAAIIGPITLKPHGLGPITIRTVLSIDDDTAPAALVTLKVYKADGTTLIDTASVRTVSSEAPTAWDYQLSSAALSAVPTADDRRALKVTYTVSTA